MEVLLMIYSKTPWGQSSFQSRSVPLTPRQRSAFILFDGKRAIDDVLKVMSGLGVTPEDVNHLVSLGLLAPQIEGAAAPIAIAIPSPNANAG